MPLIDRTASGPNRAPERNEVDPSHGIPYTAASTPSRSVVWGRRANVRGPVNLGDSVASGGSRMVILLDSRIGGRLWLHRDPVVRRRRGVADPSPRPRLREARDGDDPPGVRTARRRPSIIGAAGRLR